MANRHFRSHGSNHLNERVEEYIGSCEESIDFENEAKDRDSTSLETIVPMGTSLIKVVRKIDRSLGRMIINSYINCLLLSTSTLYVASSVFFNKYEAAGMHFVSGGCVAVTFLGIMRLLYLTNAGQGLGTAMKTCSHTLDRLKLKVTTVPREEIKVLKQDLKYHSDSPINPLAAFSLSSGTLVGTFATIITYLIVLIQFKATEKQEEKLCGNQTTL